MMQNYSILFIKKTFAFFASLRTLRDTNHEK